MRNLDETDIRILQLLMKDGRCAYTDIADEVGLTPPTISDRVARLHDIGVIQRFTVEVDRSMLTRPTSVLVDI